MVVAIKFGSARLVSRQYALFSSTAVFFLEFSNAEALDVARQKTQAFCLAWINNYHYV